MDPQQEILVGRELGWDVIAHHPIEEASADQKDKRRKEVAERNHIRANFVWRLRKIGLVQVFFLSFKLLNESQNDCGEANIC